MARRLVERGVPYVTINYKGWDTHKQHFQTMRRKLPEMDKGMATLLQDLADRGLLDSTIVWWSGEFGRTPKVQWEAPWNGGRGHYGKVFSAVVAGGGFKGGHVVGASDAKGEAVKERPVYPCDLIGSMYELLGIDPDAKLPHPQGLTVRAHALRRGRRPDGRTPQGDHVDGGASHDPAIRTHDGKLRSNRFTLSTARPSGFGLRLSAFGFRPSDFPKALATLLALMAFAPWGRAQPSPPRIGYVYPAGGRQGTTCSGRGRRAVSERRHQRVSSPAPACKPTLVEYARPLTQKEFNDLRDKLKELQEKRAAAARSGRRRGGPAGSQSGTNVVWTAADEKTGRGHPAEALPLRPQKKPEPGDCRDRHPARHAGHERRAGRTGAAAGDADRAVEPAPLLGRPTAGVHQAGDEDRPRRGEPSGSCDSTMSRRPLRPRR